MISDGNDPSIDCLFIFCSVDLRSEVATEAGALDGDLSKAIKDFIIAATNEKGTCTWKIWDDGLNVAQFDLPQIVMSN